jgi:hypothetical protein
MKGKMIVLVGMSVLFAVLFFQSSAFAYGEKFYVCNVVSVGIVRTDEILIDLTHNEDGKTPEFYNRRFTAKAGREKEMLAASLTALSIGTRIKVWTNPDLGTTADRILVSMFATTQVE